MSTNLSKIIFYRHKISSVQSLNHFLRFATRWTAACQASLSITTSQNLLKLMSIESVMQVVRSGTPISQLRVEARYRANYPTDSYCCYCLLTKSRPTMLRSQGLQPSRLLCQGVAQARILEWVVMAYARRFSQPEMNPHLLHWQVHSSPLSCQESPQTCIRKVIYK